MHLCQDEIMAAAGIFGTIGVACRYCWYRVSGIFRRPKQDQKCDHEH